MSLERGITLALNYYAAAVRLCPQASRQELVKDLLRSILNDTQAYSFLLESAEDPRPSDGLLARLVPDRKELSVMLLKVADDMRVDAQYYKAIRIYMNEQQFSRSLALINRELVRIVKDTAQVLRNASEYQQYADLGRDCVDKLRGSSRVDPTTSVEISNFELLQRLRDVVVQDRKGQSQQVLRTLEEMRFLRGGRVASGDSSEYRFLMDEVPEVIVISARRYVLDKFVLVIVPTISYASSLCFNV